MKIKRFSVSLRWPQYGELAEYCKRLGISRGEAIRRAIDKLLGRK